LGGAATALTNNKSKEELDVGTEKTRKGSSPRRRKKNTEGVGNQKTAKSQVRRNSTIIKLRQFCSFMGGLRGSASWRDKRDVAFASGKRRGVSETVGELERKKVSTDAVEEK